MTNFKVGDLVSYHRDNNPKKYCIIQKIDISGSTTMLWGVWYNNMLKAREMKEDDWGDSGLSFITVDDKYNIQYEKINWRLVL